MKKLILVISLVTGATAAHAGGIRFHHAHHHHHGWHSRPSFSFHVGTYPYYSYFRPYSYSYYYPAYSYAYAPVYRDSYVYSRPNYAVSGTLMGALTGGLIGHSIERQGWEGAGIGAAAGLVLGSLAERSARSQEHTVYQAPAVYQQQGYAPDASAAPNAATVANAPVVPNAANVPNAPAAPTAMSGANALFGR